MECSELTTVELNAKLNAIFKKVAENSKILDSTAAKKMIGKRIMAYQEGYQNQEWVDEFEVVAITNEFEMAQAQPYENSDFGNMAEYWESYMDAEQIQYHKNCLLLLVRNNINPLTTEVGGFPIDSECIFSYRVFFSEI